MSVLGEMALRLNLAGNFRELATSDLRRKTLLSLASTEVLTQTSVFPIALIIPSIARQFGVSVSEASWLVIIRLLLLGSTVFLMARLGEKFGHVRIYFLGAVLVTAGTVLAAASPTLTILIGWSGLIGLGLSMMTANANAILALVFPPAERGRAFSIPITASRFATILAMAAFGVFLAFLDWRMVYLSIAPMGIWAIFTVWPLLKGELGKQASGNRSLQIDYLGAALLVATLAVFILSGIHLHDGIESFTSAAAQSYHLPMHLLALALLGLFVAIQLRSPQPFVDFRYFKRKHFSMALYSNVTFHLSMLAVTTLIPIMVEDGMGYSPLVVTFVLLPGQILGLILPPWAGWIWDRYNPRWLRPASMGLIALGFLLVGLFGFKAPVWGMALFLFPIFFGSNLFNTVNNALVMNTLPENRTFASGMMETTRHMGHTVGATLAATVMGLALPFAIETLPTAEAQGYYRLGFQYAALTVVWVMLTGSIVAAFQKSASGVGQRASQAPQPQPQPTGGD